MGTSIFGGPTVTKTPPPAPLFPGMQQDYINQLKSSGVTGSSFNTLNQAAQTGLPTDVGPAFDAMKASMQHGISEGRANLIENFGVKGLRSGSNVMQAGSDFEAQTQTNFANILAQYTQQASEAAANRRVGAAGVGAGLASEPGLAFTPTGVVSNKPGILGGIASLMSAFFPEGLGA